MSAMERGLHIPTLSTMMRLCRILGIRLSRMAREIDKDYNALRKRAN